MIDYRDPPIECSLQRGTVLIIHQLLLLTMLHSIEGLVGKWNRVSFSGGGSNISEINPPLLQKYSVLGYCLGQVVNCNCIIITSRLLAYQACAIIKIPF